MEFKCGKKVRETLSAPLEQLIAQLRAERKEIKDIMQRSEANVRAKSQELKMAKKSLSTAQKDAETAESHLVTHSKDLQSIENQRKTAPRNVHEIYKGYLLKQGGGKRAIVGRKTWKERLCLLSAPRDGIAWLYYFSNPLDSTPRGCIAINENTGLKFGDDDVSLSSSMLRR